MTVGALPLSEGQGGPRDTAPHFLSRSAHRTARTRITLSCHSEERSDVATCCSAADAPPSRDAAISRLRYTFLNARWSLTHNPAASFASSRATRNLSAP